MKICRLKSQSHTSNLPDLDENLLLDLDENLLNSAFDSIIFGTIFYIYPPKRTLILYSSSLLPTIKFEYKEKF